jgi:LPXTG-motif cell wall-anchored protein
VTVGGDGGAALANTGFSAAPVLGAGALALLAGGGLMVAARRRQTV